MPQPFVGSLWIQPPDLMLPSAGTLRERQWAIRNDRIRRLVRVKHREKRKTSSSFDHNTCISNENLIVRRDPHSMLHTSYASFRILSRFAEF